MFEIKKHPELIHHIKQTSRIYQERPGEIVVFCPYCNDANRKANPTHGHLYISTHSPVFYCFRCNASGTILRLLLDTEFNDEETLNYISKLIGKSTRLIYRINLETDKQIQKNNIIKEHLVFKKTNPNDYLLFTKYITKRLGGSKNTIKFLIFPTYEKINGELYLSCLFKNEEQQPTSSKIIKLDSYKNYNGFYYFQKKDFTKYKQIVITEGAFDMINVYIYSNQFPNTFFISANGKNYIGVIEKLLGDGLIFGDYIVNIIFDSDYNFRHLKYKIIKYVSYINNSIQLKFFKPLLGKDVGEFPGILEV